MLACQTCLLSCVVSESSWVHKRTGCVLEVSLFAGGGGWFQLWLQPRGVEGTKWVQVIIGEPRVQIKVLIYIYVYPSVRQALKQNILWTTVKGSNKNNAC